MTQRITIITLFCATLLMCSCRNANKATVSTADNTGYFSESKLLNITFNDNYSIVNIHDPWNEGKTLHTYILVPKDKSLPADLPKGTVIRTPVTNALVYSSVHAQAIKELGKVSAIKGVCDAEYFKIPEITQGLKNGTISNVGSSMAPSIEKAIAMKPELIVLSPFQNSGYGAIATIGIPILECADYMEDSPLGRAEWIKLFGLLFGNEAEADVIFEHTHNEYVAIKDSVSSVTAKPKVITEMVMSGVWFVPGGKSYMARIISDAGAAYPWSDNNDSGSLQLDLAQVLNAANDADCWLIKSSTIKSYSDIRKENELYTKFKAFGTTNIWVCNPQTTTLFEDFPFHPELLLKEYAAIFHPDIFGGKYNYRYFKPLDKQ
ncbi:MAG: ABC transporter substrate-binding protein [Muribaculaceae bacterium]